MEGDDRMSFESRNPATGEVVARYPEHTAEEVEIFSSENWWKRPGEEVIATCIERYRTVC